MPEPHQEAARATLIPGTMVRATASPTPLPTALPTNEPDDDPYPAPEPYPGPIQTGGHEEKHVIGGGWRMP